MALTLHKSHLDKLGFDFPKAVEDFRQAKLDHRSIQGVAAPRAAHPLVEQAVIRILAPDRQSEDFVEDYTIVDDTPPAPAPPTLEQRKHALMRQVQQAEAEAVRATVPLGKQPLRRTQYQALRQKQAGDLTSAELAQVATYRVQDDHFAALALHAATQCSDIEDLTEATIGGWKMAAFPV